jgi:hypothetical protein
MRRETVKKAVRPPQQHELPSLFPRHVSRMPGPCISDFAVREFRPAYANELVFDPEDHQIKTLKMRAINSSNEKIVSSSGVRGTAVATAKRETSCSANGTTRISRTIA